MKYTIESFFIKEFRDVLKQIYAVENYIWIYVDKNFLDVHIIIHSETGVSVDQAVDILKDAIKERWGIESEPKREKLKVENTDIILKYKIDRETMDTLLALSKVNGCEVADIDDWR